ncbi:hypothetical protein [Bacterioplanoides sp.]|uniref:hypothetical protein n=1 Tax=Bacterioplanoides sp. TaxID=2066072 RepID=UPI003B59C54C
MKVENGKYYAASVVESDVDFELEMEVKDDGAWLTGQRISFGKPSNGPEAEIDAVKAAVKDGISEFKKGGLKSAFGLVKKLFDEVIKSEEERQKQKQQSKLKDLLDPEQAFAFDDSAYVDYHPIYKLEDKHTNTDRFQFRTDTSYGVLEEVEPGLLREVSFTYPPYEYAQKHHRNEVLEGAGSSDWRREDSKLHQMRVHYLSRNKVVAEAAAKATNLEKVKQQWFSVDRSSTRSNELTRFSEPDFSIDANTGDVSIERVIAWFLPRLTQQGRQIQYNWDAFRVRVTQGDKLIKRLTSSSMGRSHEVIKSRRNDMEPYDGGYIDKLTPGKYELRVAIYEEEFFCYPFEVIKTESTDIESSHEHYYSLCTPKDDCANLVMDTDVWELFLHYPLIRLLEQFGSDEKVEITTLIKRDGEVWQGYEWNEFDKGAMEYEVHIRNRAAWTQERIRLTIPLGDDPSVSGRGLGAIGDFSLHIEANGKEIDCLEVNILKTGEIVGKNIDIDAIQELAEKKFPEEHGGLLVPFERKVFS